MSLEDDLLDAGPGDVIEFRGEQRLGKVIGVRGEPGRPIVLRGADETAILVPTPDYLYAVARFENSAYLRLEKFKIDGQGRAERALQIFRSDHVEVFDLVTAAVQEDHLHFAGCNHVLVRRIYSDGVGGVNMGGGRAGHQTYFTRIDGGGDCEDLIAEDLDSVEIAGAAEQANGDGAWLSGVVFRRVRADGYGKWGGSGVNIAQCRGTLIEDLILVAHPANNNPGVNSYDGSSGTEMRRYDIDADDTWAGPMDATPGEPTPPSPPGFVSIPEPPGFPPFEPELGAGMQYCPTCDGSTVQLGPEGEPIPCVTCNGTGQIPLPG